MPDWRHEAVGGVVFLVLMVLAGGGAIANADATDGTSDVAGSTSQHSSSIGDRSESTSPQEAQSSSSTAQTATEAGGADDADSSDTSPPTDEAVLTPADPAPSAPPDSTSATLDTPTVPSDDSPTTDASTTTQDTGAGTEVDPPPDPSISTSDTPPVPADDNPPVQDTGATTGTDSSTPQAVSSSDSIASAAATATAGMTDDSMAGNIAAAVSTITASLPTLADDHESAVVDSSAVTDVIATLVQPALSAYEPSVVAPLSLTEVPLTVPLASVTAAFAPPGILQWFAVLTWFQLQWLIQWQQLNGWNATPSRFDVRDTRLMSTFFENSLTPAFLASHLPWLRTAQGAPHAMSLTDLPIDHDFLQQISMTVAAGAASLPAIARAVTDQVRSQLGFPSDSPCVSTFIRSVSVWALFTAAALGIFGIISLTGLGVTMGFRQARAGFALQTCGLARFTGPGPLGVVREGGFVDIRSRCSGTGPPRLRVVGTDRRNSA